MLWFDEKSISSQVCTTIKNMMAEEEKDVYNVLVQFTEKLFWFITVFNTSEMFPLIVHHLQSTSHVKITHQVASGKYKFNNVKEDFFFILGSWRTSTFFNWSQTKKMIRVYIIHTFSWEHVCFENRLSLEKNKLQIVQTALRQLSVRTVYTSSFWLFFSWKNQALWWSQKVLVGELITL